MYPSKGKSGISVTHCHSNSKSSQPEVAHSLLLEAGWLACLLAIARLILTLEIVIVVAVEVAVSEMHACVCQVGAVGLK